METRNSRVGLQQGEKGCYRHFYNIQQRCQENLATYQSNMKTIYNRQVQISMHPVQMNNFHSNDNHTNLNWLHFDDDSKAKEKLQVLE